MVDGGSADTPAKGVTAPRGKPGLSRAQISSGSWSDRRPATDAAQVARSETTTAPGTSATYTGSTRVSVVRAYTGARPLLGVAGPAQIVPARDASPPEPPQCSSAARPSGDRQATAAGPGTGITAGSVIRARSVSAAHPSGVAALTASVKYLGGPGQPEPCSW